MSDQAHAFALWWFVWWSAVVNAGPKVTNRFLNGAAARPLPKALSFTQQPVNRKNAAAVIGLVLGFLILCVSATSLEVLAARISPLSGLAALGLLAAPWFGYSAAHAYVLYEELRRRAVD